ncbi:hypothetical protein [Xenorhabdus innexi]|uniref:Uncharacterized protein n=1 Tax=Xenorhabdus innexi TaxID=290109 RepID=A0A1N6MYX9_9GAMM|nr:hypothetical protein [Xenorhabdus innexi]PHM31225.1 hypothetical protein Xinn_02934 [Xenorhabdus innexi]SIP74017.1 hypothetical protein XIS1_490014 [Xenorhabdus innexi]
MNKIKKPEINSFPNNEFWDSLERIVNGLSNLIKNIISALNKLGIISYDLSFKIKMILSGIASAICVIFDKQKKY